MKTVLRPMLVAFVLMATMLSCNKDEVFVEPTADTPVDTPTDGTTAPEDTFDPVTDSTTPCDFTLDGVQSGDTVVIDCVLDLQGQTVTLPPNVTLVYEGGDIINGTLNFSDSSIISGELLNSSLTLGGSTPQLKDTTFDFDPQRWGIVEGEVTMEIAKRNTSIIQNIISAANDLGITTFKIDKMDAYFYGNGSFNYNIILPSNFHLSMTNNTHLRTFPSIDSYSTFLIVIQNAENVIVSGGNLHGDRDLYDRKDNLPPSHTIKIKSGTNVLIDNVYMSNATEDGLAIESYYLATDSRYIPSNNIKITNCVFESNRRINLTITDGRNIIVENCTFIDGGIDTDKSNAAAPSCNIDIEPVAPNQYVNNVIIKNNKQYVNDRLTNPKAGGFLISHGNGPIIIENNEMIDCGVSYHTANGVVIRNNTITGGSIGAGSAETFNRTDIIGNEIYGNTVKSTGTALSIAGNGVNVHDNTLEGTVGISLGAGSIDQSKGVSNSLISNNVVKANVRGITSMNTMQNVTVAKNTITMLEGASFSLSFANKWSYSSDANFIIKNNVVRGVKSNSTTGAPSNLISGNSIKLLDNDFGDLQLNGTSNITLTGNKIDANIGENGILFYSDAPNSVIRNNFITTYPSKTPLSIQCIKTAGDVTLSSGVLIENNNTCNEI